MFGMMISSSEVDEDKQFASSGKAWIGQVTLQEEEKRFRFFSLFVLKVLQLFPSARQPPMGANLPVPVEIRSDANLLLLVKVRKHRLRK